MNGKGVNHVVGTGVKHVSGTYQYFLVARGGIDQGRGFLTQNLDCRLKRHLFKRPFKGRLTTLFMLLQVLSLFETQITSNSSCGMNLDLQ